MNQPDIPAWLRGSEMGEFIYVHDWTESGLGPVRTWPPDLKFAVNIILLLPSPAMLLWGPDLIEKTSARPPYPSSLMSENRIN